MLVTQNELIENLRHTGTIELSQFGVDLPESELSNYIAVRIAGHCMTTADARSIPHTSIVLIKEIDLTQMYEHELPLNVPVCIELYNPDTGSIARCVKIISFADYATGRLRLSCYDKNYPDRWCSFEHLHRLWTVEGVCGQG